MCHADGIPVIGWGYKAICGLRGQKCGLIFVVELTLALFLAE